MPEQDDFIGFLRDVPSYVDSNNVGQPYISYVSYVLELFPGHIKDYKMVSFLCYFFTLVHYNNALLSILILCFQ